MLEEAIDCYYDIIVIGQQTTWEKYYSNNQWISSFTDVKFSICFLIFDILSSNNADFKKRHRQHPCVASSQKR